MALLRVAAVIAAALLLAGPAFGALDDCVWTDWFSEEDGGTAPSTLGDFPITAFDCRHGKGFCDHVRYQQCRFGGSKEERFSLETGDCEEMPPVSEEQGSRTCPSGKVATKVKCNGRYCDNLTLTCCAPKHYVLMSGVHETGWFSEEQGGKECGGKTLVDAPVFCDNSMMTGLECCGRFCDGKRMICRKVEGQPEFVNHRSRWVKACFSTGSDSECGVQLSRSIQRTRSRTWTRGFALSVENTLRSKFFFGEAAVSLGASVTTEVSTMLSVGREVTQSCGATFKPVPPLTSVQVWQYEVSVDEVDEHGIVHPLNMRTCSFATTDGPDTPPVCVPGACADFRCQSCTKPCQDGDFVGSATFCSRECRCGSHVPGCYDDATCEGDLVCCEDVGCRFGQAGAVGATSVCTTARECRINDKCR